jgi:hypothetical protein
MLGQHVRIQCQDACLEDIVRANFGAMLVTAAEQPPDLDYLLAADAGRSSFMLSRAGVAVASARQAADLLFLLEKELVVALQRRRSDLLFLHAAALVHRGRAYVLVGDSGHGKSTTAWGLLHHGFGYLSDELAPIDLVTLEVLAYPHALCLKRAPPPEYPLPQGVLDLQATVHVPAQAMPQAAAADARCPVEAVLFVRYLKDATTPVLRELGRAEAGARLYVASLNALAHPHRGMDAVARIAARVSSFALDAAGLRDTCDMVRRWATGMRAPAAAAADNSRSDNSC